jgi:hypothetical protein
MKQICVSMGYCVNFSSYTFGVNLVFTTSFLFGPIHVYEAHQDRTVALVLGSNIFYLFFHMDNDKEKTHLNYSSIANSEKSWPHFLDALSTSKLFVE